MHQALILSLLLPLTAAIQAPLAAKPNEEAKSSVDVQSSTLLVRLETKAKMIGYPAVCPGSSPEENQAEIICMAELYEAKARVIKHLGGPETDNRLTIRFTAHSFHAVWQKDVRFLLVVRPFEDKGNTGHFAWRWDWENKNGEFCQSAAGLAEEKWSPIKQAFGSGKQRMTGEDDDNWEEGTKLICITGREKALGAIAEPNQTANAARAK